jgi:hypothetical protein
MTLKDIWAEYKENTWELSENARKLAFAGAAICWFFKSSDATFPGKINVSLAFIILFFFFDMLQYLFSAILLRTWATRKEKILKFNKLPLDTPVEKPRWLVRHPFYLFLLKLIFLLASFAFLVMEFVSRIR